MDHVPGDDAPTDSALDNERRDVPFFIDRRAPFENLLIERMQQRMPGPISRVTGAGKPGPAERALVEGIRAYDDGQYADSEAALKRALAGGLVSARDRATAHKLIAFITCLMAALSAASLATNLTRFSR